MSSFHSDKCTKEELQAFKKEVVDWLKDKTTKKLPVRAFRCYNGDVRIYTGHNEYQNDKSSFRRTQADKDEKGNIIGWHGTRGHHTTRYAEYLTINRDEWDMIKEAYETKDEFYDELIFSKL